MLFPAFPKRMRYNETMSKVEEIERAIEQLRPEEFQQVEKHVREIAQRRWDEQLDRDSAGGKLDFLFEEAEAERKARLLKDWPPSA